MDYLEIGEVVALQENILKRTGGSQGIRDIGGMESALELPKMTMFDEDLTQRLLKRRPSSVFRLS